MYAIWYQKACKEECEEEFHSDGDNCVLCYGCLLVVVTCKYQERLTGCEREW